VPSALLDDTVISNELPAEKVAQCSLTAAKFVFTTKRGKSVRYAPKVQMRCFK
jgi:hypothetical protein